MAVAVGQRCVVRIKITDVELRQASDIMATIVSPQGEEKCQDISFDEVSGLVYVAVVVNSVGNWSMWLNVRFANEVLYTPVFVFAEVEGEATPCDAPYIVDVEVQGESVSVTPPKVDVDAVSREEFDALAKQVTINTEAIENIGNNTIIVDYDQIAELKADEVGDDVTHPDIAELVEKIYNEQDKLILVRHFQDTHEQLDPTYFVPDTNYSRDEFGNIIITLYASYTPNYNTYGEQPLINLEISITQEGAILKVEQKRDTLLNDESVIDNLNNSYSKKPLSARQGKELDRKKVGYAEYDSESKAIMLYSDNTKKYDLGEIKGFMPATPSGDPMHDMYVENGAIYNDSASDKTVVSELYGDSITHKAGCWFLNDLGDLTTAEIRAIYNERYISVGVNDFITFWRISLQRSNMCNCRYGQTASMVIACGAATFITARLASSNITCKPASIDSLFFNCTKLRRVVNIIECQYLTTTTNAFSKCSALEDIRLKGLKTTISFSDSPLSVASAVYMLQNADASVTFTITFRADRQAIYEANTDFVNAKNAKPNITILYQ